MMRALWPFSFRSFASLLFVAGLLLSPVSPLVAAPPAEGIAVQEETTEVKPFTKPINLAIDKSYIVELPGAASTVFIANPEIADVQVVTPDRIMVFGKKAGETTLIINGEKGLLLAQSTVIVQPNLSDLRRTLRALSPDREIRAEAVPGGLILSGEATDAAIIEEARRLATRYVPTKDGDIINRIRISANDQIQIRVRFAEVSRDVDKRFGINWETIGNIGGFTFGLATGKDFITAGATAITRTVIGDDTNDALNLSYNNNHYSVNGMIDALAQDGLITILAEPSLTALSGETASFLAGGEFPVPVPQSSDTITIEWKQYGVSLAFTPTIIGKDRINLHVRPEVSQLSSVGAVTLNNVEIPSLTTRRAETTIELNSGQSFALAGLLNNQQSQTIDKFPFLGDIPVLGPLFRSSRFQNNESELVIIITPYIVKPATQERLALPTDGFVPPSDTDMFLRMRETSSDPNGRPLSGTPRAVKVEEMAIEDAPEPQPAPAPVSAVERRPQQLPASAGPLGRETMKPAASKPRKESALPSTPIPEPKIKTKALIAPSGPGGFIME